MPVSLAKAKAEDPKCCKGLANELESSISEYKRIGTVLDNKIKSLYNLKTRENTPLDSMDFIEMARKVPKLLRKEKGPFTIADLIAKCEREQMVVGSAISTLERCKDEFSKIDFKADNLILKDGKINGLHPVAQKYLEVYSTFKTMENMAAASTWRLALANNFEEIITTPGHPFLEKKQLSDIVDRANSYIQFMEKHTNNFRVGGGADKNYISDSDSKKLKERMQKVRDSIKTASTQLSSGNLGSAYKSLLGAEKGCDILDLSFNRIIEDVEMQKKEPGQYLKMRVESYGDILLGTGLPFMGGVIGFLSTGPLGIAPGAKAGMDASALWWAYRGTDGLYHSCAAGRLFSMGTALDLALMASAAKRIPGIDKVEFLRPVTRLSGTALQLSLGVGIVSDVYDLSKRDWFVTSADKREFAFYGSIFVFSTANMPITKISQVHIQKGVAIYDKILKAGGTELLEKIRQGMTVEINGVKGTLNINEKEALLLAKNLRLAGTPEAKNYADLIERLFKYQKPIEVKEAMLMEAKEAKPAEVKEMPNMQEREKSGEGIDLLKDLKDALASKNWEEMKYIYYGLPEKTREEYKKMAEGSLASSKLGDFDWWKLGIYNTKPSEIFAAVEYLKSKPEEPLPDVYEEVKLRAVGSLGKLCPLLSRVLGEYEESRFPSKYSFLYSLKDGTKIDMYLDTYMGGNYVNIHVTQPDGKEAYLNPHENYSEKNVAPIQYAMLKLLTELKEKNRFALNLNYENGVIREEGIFKGVSSAPSDKERDMVLKVIGKYYSNSESASKVMELLKNIASSTGNKEEVMSAVDLLSDDKISDPIVSDPYHQVNMLGALRGTKDKAKIIAIMEKFSEYSKLRELGDSWKGRFRVGSLLYAAVINGDDPLLAIELTERYKGNEKLMLGILSTLEKFEGRDFSIKTAKGDAFIEFIKCKKINERDLERISALGPVLAELLPLVREKGSFNEKIKRATLYAILKEHELPIEVPSLSGEWLEKAAEKVNTKVKEKFEIKRKLSLNESLALIRVEADRHEIEIISKLADSKIKKSFLMGKIYAKLDIPGLKERGDPIKVTEYLIAGLTSTKARTGHFGKLRNALTFFSKDKLRDARDYVMRSNPNQIFQQIKNDVPLMKQGNAEAAARIRSFFKDLAKKGKFTDKLPEDAEALSDLVDAVESIGKARVFDSLLIKMQTCDMTDLVDNTTVGCCTFYPDGANAEAAIYNIKDPEIGILFIKSATLEGEELDNIGAAYLVNCKDKEGRKVLLVDSVEGGEALERSSVEWKEKMLESIKQVAKENGVEYIMFNTHVANGTPKAFNRFIADKGVKSEKAYLEKIAGIKAIEEWHNEHYLEAFGGWSSPKGNVGGFVVKVE